MNTFIALLRGINVGGKNKLTMAELRELLDRLGLAEVRTYIQSGNVVFRSRSKRPGNLARMIRQSIANDRDFEPDVIVLTLDEVEKAMAANPFPKAASEPKTLHLFFLESEPPDPDITGLTEKKADNERFDLKGEVFYLHAPDGIGRSKLASNAERLLGVSATARNWRTVGRIVQLAQKNR